MLWTLILSVGGTALYFGFSRPEVSTIPKRVQEFVAKDPSTQRPVRMRPFVVAEPRLPAIPLEPTDPSLPSQEAKIEIKR
jgi:hypothetical protein